ncbi:unnamed protein product, partial [Didymodactylos carnosus]
MIVAGRNNITTIIIRVDGLKMPTHDSYATIVTG